MAVKASRVLELFIESLNMAPENQTCFTCIALEAFFPRNFIDAAILEGYVNYLGFDNLLLHHPYAVVQRHGEYNLYGEKIVLTHMIPEYARTLFREIGKKIFDEKVKYQTASYWQSKDNRNDVYLRFGVLQMMATSMDGDRVFKL